MKLRVLDWIACPVCGSDFELRSAARRDEEIISETLTCPRAHAFEIKDGFARLRIDQKLDRPPARAPLSLGAQYRGGEGVVSRSRLRAYYEDGGTRLGLRCGRQPALERQAVRADEAAAGCVNSLQ